MNTGFFNKFSIPSQFWQCLFLMLVAGGLSAQPQNMCSSVINTGSNHTVVIAANAAQLNGGALPSGSHIIIGFMESGSFKCVNFTQWSGNATSTAAYGKESGVSPKNGFEDSEVFSFRVELPDGTVLDDINVTYAPVGGFVSHQGNYANNGISQITSMAIASVVTPTGPNLCGPPIITSGSQTIAIPITPQIDGANLQNGAYIIVGYKDINGTFHCINYTQWNGNPTSIAAYEDDATTTEKDGFSPGNEFVYQIEMPNGTVLNDLVATYEPEGGVVTAQGNFESSSDISQIKSLTNNVPQPSLCGTPIVTSGSQTIAIPSAPLISGAPLTLGAFIIVGYKDGNGVFHCINYVQWNGVPTSIAAYINDNGNTNKNGFDIGDELVYQIEMPNGTIFDNILALYEPLGSIVTAQGIFEGDKELSLIKSMEDFEPIDCNVDKPVISLVSNQAPTCAGGTDGALIISASATHAIQSIQWTGGPSGEQYSNIGAGDYTVTVIDIHDCSATATYTVAPTDGVTLSATVVHEECTAFGEVTLTGLNGTAPYTFEGTLTAATNINIISNLNAGTYNVKATDSNGCASPLIEVTVENRCGCTDKDKDGVCLEDDCDDDNPSITYGPGSSCDDGDDCTQNDVYDDNCNCAGTPRTTDPVLVGVPADVTVECDDILAPAIVTASGLTVEFNEIRSGDDCNFVLTRIWRVMDQCGNSASAQQIVDASDNTAPVLHNVPGDITVNSNLGETFPVDNVTATDNCQEDPLVLLATPSIFPDPCSNFITYTRSWTADDRCGNTSSSSQMVTIIDDNFFQDDDGDGVCNREDKCPGFNDNEDADNDGIPDGCEQCDGTLEVVLSESFDVSCNGGTDGKLVINILGGDAPYSILWSNSATTLFNDGLAAGTYSATVLDINNCPASASFTLSEPDAIQVSADITPQGCDPNTGAINITVTDGTAPYTYDWLFNGTSEDLSNLNAGDYHLYVTDNNNCRTDRIIFTVEKDCGCTDKDKDGVCADFDCDDNDANIGEKKPVDTDCDDGDPSTTDDKILADGCTCQGTPILVCDIIITVLNKTDPSCADRADGIIAVQASNGVAPYEYKWSTGQEGTNGITGVEGDYTVSITDATGCEVVKTFTLIGPDPITIEATIVDATCGQANGSISITTNGGTGNYTYLWNNVESTKDQHNLAAGNYTIKVRDQNFCEVYLTLEVRDFSGPDCNPDDNTVECDKAIITFGNGQIKISIGDGNNYRYVIHELPFWGVAAECNYSCGDMFTISLPNGGYAIRVYEENEWKTPFCETKIKLGDSTGCDDSDGDGVCDNADRCPGYDDHADADNDNIPDGCDDCDNRLAGTTCDDGNPNTINDVFDAQCNCEGTIITDPCFGIGDTDGDGVCDDTDRCPGHDDHADADNDNIPDGCDDCDNRLAGTTCDDGNPNTANDVFDAQCNCVGISIGGDPTICEVNITTDGNVLTVSGMDEPFTRIQIYRGIVGVLVHLCDYYDNCPESVTLSDLAEGTYTIKVESYNVVNNRWIRICDILEYVVISDGGSGCTDQDKDGICAENDCNDNDDTIGRKQTPNTQCDDSNPNTNNDRIQADGCTCLGTPIITDPCANKGGDQDQDGICAEDDCNDSDNTIGRRQSPGTSCNDRDGNTENDVIQSDGCTCKGTSIPTGDPNCDAVAATAGDGSVTVSGLTSPIEHVKLYLLGNQNSQTLIDNCTGDCGDSWTVTGLSAGNYLILFTLRDQNWVSICDNGTQDLKLYVTVVNNSAIGRNKSTADKLDKHSSLKVYPNPAQEEAWIDLSSWSNQSVDLVIYNHLSQVMQEKHIEKVKASRERIDLKAMANGLYYIQLKTKDQKPVTKKLMISRLY